MLAASFQRPSWIVLFAAFFVDILVVVAAPASSASFAVFFFLERHVEVEQPYGSYKTSREMFFPVNFFWSFSK